VAAGNASTILVVETLRIIIIILLARSTFRLSHTKRFGFVRTLSLDQIP